jgi:hypothetical protein
MKILFKQTFQPPVTYSLLGPNIPLSTLFSDSLSLCSSFSLKDQVSHTYKATGKIVIPFSRAFKQQTGRKKKFWTEC